jgi:LysM repeat protein/lysophospholipase L1-like esterase
MNLKSVITFLVSVAGVIPLSAQTDTTRLDSVHHILIASKLNAIEFYDRRAIEPFFTRWHSDTVTRLTVAHFGDSHIQPGIFPGEVRAFMQGEKGYGGIGMIFPYSAAKTYSPIQYKSVHYGRWLFAKGLEPRPKLPLGVSGMTIRTYDSAAGFKITFREPPPEHYKKIKLYFKGGTSSFDVRLLAGTFDTVVTASQKPDAVPFVEVMLPDSSSSVHVQMLKTGKLQSQFEFYGMSLESESGRGLVYHSLGVGGAPYNSLLAEVLADSHLPTLRPDLVILDFGTNDFLYSQQIAPDLRRQIVQTIQWIRQLVPGVNILLTSTQDMYRHGANISAAREFSLLVRSIARAEGCALYDWYRISGGQYAMGRWVGQRLARADHIHLTSDGYLLKGKLFSAALEQTMRAYFREPGIDSLVLFDPKVDSIQADSLIRVAPAAQVTRIRHEIRNGESLSTIAEKYGVRVADIMRVNRLSSSTIIAGNYLTIEYGTQRQAAAKPKPAAVSTSKDVVQYKVVSGDTLSEIAERFQVSVKSIKKLNGLRSSRIVEGKTLLIPK